jgi:hypothetical protein
MTPTITSERTWTDEYGIEYCEVEFSGFELIEHPNALNTLHAILMADPHGDHPKPSKGNLRRLFAQNSVYIGENAHRITRVKQDDPIQEGRYWFGKLKSIDVKFRDGQWGSDYDEFYLWMKW